MQRNDKFRGIHDLHNSGNYSPGGVPAGSHCTVPPPGVRIAPFGLAKDTLIYGAKSGRMDLERGVLRAVADALRDLSLCLSSSMPQLNFGAVIFH